MAFNRPFPNLVLCSRLSYVVSLSDYNVCLYETDVFSFRIRCAQSRKPKSSYNFQMTFFICITIVICFLLCQWQSFYQLIFSDCQMLFLVAHEGIIMTLKSTDMTKLLTGTRKIHCSVQPVPLFIQGCQPIY